MTDEIARLRSKLRFTTETVRVPKQVARATVNVNMRSVAQAVERWVREEFELEPHEVTSLENKTINNTVEYIVTITRDVR